MSCNNIHMPDLRGNELYAKVNSYVIIDTETTGFSYKNDSIIEFSAVKVEDDLVVDTLSFLAKPCREIPEEITDLTGITNEMVCNEKCFCECIETVLDFIGEYPIIGHNVTFDIDRLNYCIYTNTGEHLHNDYIDTLHLARQTINDIQNYNLSTIADYFDINVDVSHRALDDCMTVFNIYQPLCNLLGQSASKNCAADTKVEKIDTEDYAHLPKLNYDNTNFQEEWERYDKMAWEAANKYIAKINPDNEFVNKIKDKKFKVIGCCREIDSDIITRILLGIGCDGANYYKDTEYIFLGTYQSRVYANKERIKYSTALIKAEEAAENGTVIMSCSDLISKLGLQSNHKQKKNKSTNYISQKNICPTNQTYDENHPLYQKTVVITGALEQMARSEAYLCIKNVGGLCGDSVTRKTNYLVTNSTAMTGKMKKAVEYKEKGQDIQIIDEIQLYKLLDNDK